MEKVATTPMQTVIVKDSTNLTKLGITPKTLNPRKPDLPQE